MIYDTTYEGLQCWYKHCFEKFGWMLITRSKDNIVDKDRIMCYQQTVNNLCDTLQVVSEERNRSQDRINDLRIMFKNTKILLENIGTVLLKQELALAGGAKKVVKKLVKNLVKKVV